MVPRSVPAAITMRKIRLTQADALLAGMGAPLVRSAGYRHMPPPQAPRW